MYENDYYFLFALMLFNRQFNGNTERGVFFCGSNVCLMIYFITFPYDILLLVMFCVDFVISKWEFIIIFILILSVHFPKKKNSIHKLLPTPQYIIMDHTRPLFLIILSHQPLYPQKAGRPFNWSTFIYFRKMVIENLFI